MNKITLKKISTIIMLCFCSCFLMGCPSPADESKEAKEYVELAIPIVEKEFSQLYPNAVIDRKSFHGVSDIKTGPDHGLTDCVEGQYKNGGIGDILINVKTEEIYTTDKHITVSTYAMKRAYELYNA